MNISKHIVFVREKPENAKECCGYSVTYFDTGHYIARMWGSLKVVWQNKNPSVHEYAAEVECEHGKRSWARGIWFKNAREIGFVQ